MPNQELPPVTQEGTPDVRLNAEQFSTAAAHDLTAPGMSRQWWRALENPNETAPSYWHGLVQDGALSVGRLQNALTRTFQQGHMEHAGGGRAERYTTVSQIGTEALYALCRLGGIYSTHQEILPGPTVNTSAMAVKRWTKMTGIEAIDVTNYATNQLHFEPIATGSLRLDRFMLGAMRQRLPELPLEYHFNYEAYEQGAPYQVHNGVAYTGLDAKVPYRGLTPAAFRAELQKPRAAITAKIPPHLYFASSQFLKALHQIGITF